MKKNPGRKERRQKQFRESKRPGDLNRKSTYKMNSSMGMKKRGEK